MVESSRRSGADRRAVLAGGAALAMAAASSRALAASSSDAPVARTVNGQVRGELSDGVSVFRGIPYGAPTGGGARFLPPQAVKSWGGVREARRFADQCPQDAPAVAPQWSSWTISVGESEDCLALNVWTPAAGDGRKRPVMVWLHGGGYSIGNGSSGFNDGVRLCQRGDVVVVSVNHRLNVFGYLYLAQLGGPDLADSGNIGQLDIIAALEWVRDNIAGFGGDPDRVMIFGESGGGGKVATLMAMPAAKGLFHRAAIQSGPYLTALKPDDATATAREVLKAAGVSDHSPGDLRHTPADRLIAAMKQVSKGRLGVFGPVVDGKNLRRDPFSPDAPALSAEVPVIVGYNATETTVLAPLPAGADLDWDALKGRLADQLPGADAGALIAGFQAGRPHASPTDLYYAITTEHGMGAKSIALAERKAALGKGAAYLYRLEFETPVAHLRSAHSLDLPLVFDNVPTSGSLLGAAQAQAQTVADQMAGAWLAFAHTGSPNAAGLASWPRYDLRARSTMIFDVESRAVNDPHADERRLTGVIA